MAQSERAGALLMKGNTTKALILVDLQKDFLPGGALAVAESDAVIPVANQRFWQPL
jgi:hypothetical protein